ncbi:S-layer homology domain-containing protein [Lyngbya aestuarii]|uniref:S-layer homology domain-containing protein n=1 Tax=Lyngbya aestuarii TaxID=118322 RepID=UPI00403DCF7F
MVQSTLYVNPVTGNDGASGQANDPLKTLTKALRQVTPPTIIYLAAGSYNATGGEVFPLLIPARVIVLGQESSKGKGIVILGGGQYDSPTFGNQNVALLLDSQAELRGVTVTNQAARGTGVWLESTAPIIAHSTFIGCSREGIFVTGTSKPLILDNILLENASSGIFLVRQAKGEVRRNLCQKTGYGIAISDTAAPLVSDNSLVGNRVGIFLSRQARPVLRRNLIEKNTSDGLLVTGEVRLDFGSNQDPAGNILRDNGKADLQNDSPGTVVSVGNLLNPARVSGAVDFQSSQISIPVMGPAQFNDLSGHWGEAFIQGLVKRGLISGFPDGTFRPEEMLNRAQYAAIIAKTFNLPRQPGTGTGLFRDIPNDFWARAAIRVAASMGFISGFPDGTFRPQQSLTKVQALVSLVNGLGLAGTSAHLLQFYSDRAQIPSYATEAVATATQKQLVVNYPQINQLKPILPISRAEIAALIYQALVATGRADAITSPYIVALDQYIASFRDLQGHWAADFIRRLGNLDLVSGFADGSFKPDSLLNRAQYAALLVKIFNPIAKRPASQFIDVPTNFWAAQVISQAYRGGFLSGFPDQTFQPQRPLRRVELIASLVNGLALPKAETQVLEIYEDRDTIPAYAKSVVAAATKAGIIVNYPNPAQLQPKREATRAEAAAFAHQALVKIGRLNPLNSAYIVSVVSG